MSVLWSDLTGSSCCEYHMHTTRQSKSTEIDHFSSLISQVIFSVFDTEILEIFHEKQGST